VATISLQPAEAVDTEFLVRVYGSTRTEELARTDWDAARQDAFIRAQFAAQDAHYRQHYAGARFDIIVVDGEPAGRLYVHRVHREIRLIDIALLPEFRGRGIGTQLLRELMSEAMDSGRPLTIHVETFNPAMRLYERLGFKPREERVPYVLMEWTPPFAEGGR
jgi:ribosomal protein S18 acetylase RimI-like enzyme